MAKRAETGVFQVKNGQWGYRFTLQIEGKRISRRKFTDADGNKLLSKKQAQNAREEAILQAHIDEERKRLITRRTFDQVYNEYCEKGRADRAYMTIRKQDCLWRNHLKERFGKRYIDEINVAEINDYLAELYYKEG